MGEKTIWLGTVFGSLPPSDQHAGFRPRSLGFLFARPELEGRAENEGAIRSSHEEVDST
jgi:hypothetical protein